MINVLIAEDQLLIAMLVKEYLSKEEDINVVGITLNGEETLEKLRNESIDVAIIDLMLPKIDGIRTTEKIVEENLNTKALMFSANFDFSTIQKALSSGASGFISKSSKADDIINGIRTIYSGGCYLCAESLKSISNKDTKKEEKSPFGKSITKREQEIINLISQGMSNSEIAEKLCLSKRTVESHRRNILQKFGEKNFLGLIRTLMEFNVYNLNKNGNMMQSNERQDRVKN